MFDKAAVVQNGVYKANYVLSKVPGPDRLCICDITVFW